MKDFSGQLKKYKVTVDDLLEKNKKLEVRTKAGEAGKMKDTMEKAKLESDLYNMKRLLDRIPPEILEQVWSTGHKYPTTRDRSPCPVLTS